MSIYLCTPGVGGLCQNPVDTDKPSWTLWGEGLRAAECPDLKLKGVQERVRVGCCPPPPVPLSPSSLGCAGRVKLCRSGDASCEGDVQYMYKIEMWVYRKRVHWYFWELGVLRALSLAIFGGQPEPPVPHLAGQHCPCPAERHRECSHLF